MKWEAIAKSSSYCHSPYRSFTHTSQILRPRRLAGGKWFSGCKRVHVRNIRGKANQNTNKVTAKTNYPHDYKRNAYSTKARTKHKRFCIGVSRFLLVRRSWRCNQHWWDLQFWCYGISSHCTTIIYRPKRSGLRLQRVALLLPKSIWRGWYFCEDILKYNDLGGSVAS